MKALLSSLLGVQINGLVSVQLLSIVRPDDGWNSYADDVSFGLELFVEGLSDVVLDLLYLR